MAPLIPIIVVCCVAFFAISTAVACFIHHRNINKPVRGIVLREDGVVAVPGRVIQDGQPIGASSSADAAVDPSTISSERAREGAPVRQDEPEATEEEATAERRNAGYAVQEVFDLSAAEQRRRELHNRRLNAADARAVYPMRSNGVPHPLDGTPLAQVVTFFRQLGSSRREDDDAATEEDEADAAAGHGGRADDEPADVDYGRYLVAVNISLLEPRTTHDRRRKASEADSTTVSDPFGGRTEQDWAALNDLSGIDYMTNEGTTYLPRHPEPQSTPESSPTTPSTP